MTSSDLVDTANALRLRDAAGLILRASGWLVAIMAQHALNHRHTLRVGRTHGQHAEVTTWGYRLAGITANLHRARYRLRSARDYASACKLSGPLGDHKRITVEQEREFASKLGLFPAFTATQVVDRGSYADLVFACAQMAGVIETLATEVRLSQRTEVGELFEGTGTGAVGSSAMPHKRNPILSENLCGLARVVRAQVGPTLENLPLHHERDISHSSVERVILPLVTSVTEFMALRARSLMENLRVDTERMAQNLMADPEVFSAAAKDWLMTQGLPGDLAWEVVREATLLTRSGYGPLSTTVPKIVRRMDHEVYHATDDFAPNWVELVEYLDRPISENNDVFEWLANNNEEVNGGRVN
jgi:adenylosuccinate lyase